MSDGWVSPSGGPNGTGEQPAYGTQAPPQQHTGERPPPQYGAYGPVPPAGPPQGPPMSGGPQYRGPQFRPMAPKPGVVPLRPLTLGDIFGGAFATIRGNPAATLGLALIVHLIVAVPTLVITLLLKRVVFPHGLDLSSNSDAGGSNPDLLKIDLIAPAAQIFTYIGSIVLAGMLIVVVSDAVLGRRISMRETWTRIRPRLWPLLGLTLLLAVLGLVVVAVAVGIVVLAALTVGTVLAVILGILLGIGLVVGAILLSVRLMLASPALVLEGIGPVPAIKRSWALTRRSFWRLFGISILASLVAGVVSSVVGVPGSLLNLGGYSTDGVASVLLLIGGQLWSAVVTAAVAPFVTGTTGLLYIDQRMRKEGLDVTLMSAAASRDDAPR
ncbi:proline-rich domain-containing protein [Allobranchiibius huperziae]|uniref:DUF7847 domain-containing protein n=1 Tax=Allobranchiibius huperziae TaxID=1874116 RepID=A0A853DMW5_9MICO|nr:proline-rich domain-containing protein [Allobranchiibius huperziae]NYJ75475.1 hypothetical protein [Allobranchiibius huperziae]